MSFTLKQNLPGNPKSTNCPLSSSERIVLNFANRLRRLCDFLCIIGFIPSFNKQLSCFIM